MRRCSPWPVLWLTKISLFRASLSYGRSGHDVVTSSEAGLKDKSTPDDAVLVAAIATGRAVLSHNRRHFMRLHLDMPAHAGIIVCTVDGDFIALASRIHVALQAVADASGQLLRVYRPSK